MSIPDYYILNRKTDPNQNISKERQIFLNQIENMSKLIIKNLKKLKTIYPEQELKEICLRTKKINNNTKFKLVLSYIDTDHEIFKTTKKIISRILDQSNKTFNLNNIIYLKINNHTAILSEVVKDNVNKTYYSTYVQSILRNTTFSLNENNNLAFYKEDKSLYIPSMDDNLNLDIFAKIGNQIEDNSCYLITGAAQTNHLYMDYLINLNSNYIFKANKDDREISNFIKKLNQSFMEEINEINIQGKFLFMQRQKKRILLYLVEPKLREHNDQKLDELETLLKLYGVLTLE